MWDASLRVESFGLLSTISRIFSHMLSQTAHTQTLGRQLVSCIFQWTHENTPLDRWLQLGKCLQYSSTAAHALPTQNPYTKFMNNIWCGKTKKAWLQHITINCNSNKCWVWSCSSDLLGLAVDSRMDMQSVWISHDAKWVQYMEVQRNHILLSLLSP